MPEINSSMRATLKDQSAINIAASSYKGGCLWCGI